MKTPILKRLRKINPKSSGRNNSGKVTVRHQGGREKRQLRHIDWKRNISIPARVEAIEYDPNRTASIALLVYANGVKDYVLAPQNLKIGDTVLSSESAEIKVGNCLPMKNIPVGVEIHNLEITPGKGAQMVRSAGNVATIQSKEGNTVTVKLPSGEIRLFHDSCKATVGSLGNAHHKEEILGKAGRSRHMGIRPTVRGVAQDPRSHPHGGGEGRSGVGMKSPKSPWGKRTMGRRTRDRKKFSNKLIIKRSSANK